MLLCDEEASVCACGGARSGGARDAKVNSEAGACMKCVLSPAFVVTLSGGFLPTSSKANLFNLHLRSSSMASESVRDGNSVLYFLPCISIVSDLFPTVLHPQSNGISPSIQSAKHIYIYIAKNSGSGMLGTAHGDRKEKLISRQGAAGETSQREEYVKKKKKRSVSDGPRRSRESREGKL